MKKNWIFGVGAVVCQTLAIAFVLSLVKTRLGIDQLGLWSLILSTLSITQIGQFGLGQSLIYFSQAAVKQEREIGERGHVRLYYDTVLVTTICVSSLILLLGYQPLRTLLGNLSGEELTTVLDLALPVAAISMMSAILSRVPQAALNGLGRFWLAQLSIMIGAVAYVVVAWFLIDSYGLQGVAIGHLCMALCQFLISHACIAYFSGASRSLFAKVFVGMPRFGLIRKMLRLGVSLQAVSILLFLMEPLARISIGYAGGLALVGYYEMASRVAVATREVLSRPITFVSGRFSEAFQHAPNTITGIMGRTINMTTILSGLALALPATFALLIADIWVGERHPFFLFSLTLLCLAQAYNIAALIPYYFGVGTGRNRPNLYGMLLQAAIAASVAVLAIVLKQPWLVPIGFLFAVIVGKTFIMLTVFKNEDIVLRVVLRNATVRTFVGLLGYTSVALWIAYWVTGAMPVLGAITTLSMMGLVVLGLAAYPFLKDRQSKSITL